MCGGHFLDANAALIEEGFDASGVGTGHDDVCLGAGYRWKRGRWRRSRDPCRAELSMTVPTARRLRVGFELEEVGFEEHFLKEFEHAFALLGGDVLRLVFTAPFFDEEVH